MSKKLPEGREDPVLDDDGRIRAPDWTKTVEADRREWEVEKRHPNGQLLYKESVKMEGIVGTTDHSGDEWLYSTHTVDITKHK